MDIMHKLQKVPVIGKGVGTSSGIGIGGSNVTGIRTGTITGVGAHGKDYCLTMDGLVIFRDKIYVSDNSELKKVTLREFHVKPYLGHPCY